MVHAPPLVVGDQVAVFWSGFAASVLAPRVYAPALIDTSRLYLLRGISHLHPADIGLPQPEDDIFSFGENCFAIVANVLHPMAAPTHHPHDQEEEKQQSRGASLRSSISPGIFFYFNMSNMSRLVADVYGIARL